MLNFIYVMGVTIECWIEYDEHNKIPFCEESDVLSLDGWSDLRLAKDYDFFDAISGFRKKTSEQILFDPRGLPENSRWEIRKNVSDSPLVGWLHPFEVGAALDSYGIERDSLSIEMRCVISILDFFSSRLGDERVRFVFSIE